MEDTTERSTATLNEVSLKSRVSIPEESLISSIPIAVSSK